MGSSEGRDRRETYREFGVGFSGAIRVGFDVWHDVFDANKTPAAAHIKVALLEPRQIGK